MLGIDRRAARATWTAILILFALFVLHELRQTLLVFAFAALLAYLLSPAVILVNRLSRKRASHTLSLAVVYVCMLAALGAGISVIAARAADEAGRLAQTLPRYVQSPPPLTAIPLPEWLAPHRDAIVEALRAKLEEEAQQIVPMLAKAGKGVLLALGNVVFVVLIPILSFFFLNGAEGIRDAFVDQFRRPERRLLAREIADGIHVVMTQFVKAMVLLGFVTFVCYSAFLSTIGLPYALLLSVLAGAVEFIPVAGPLSASLAIVAVTAASGFGSVAAVVIFLVVYRLVLDYVIQPWIMGGGLELSPLAVIFAILAGERLGGLAGMIFAVPAMAALRVVYLAYRRAGDAE